MRRFERLSRRSFIFASDGARESRHGEGLKVDSIREFVLNSIDWECEVKTLFRKKI